MLEHANSEESEGYITIHSDTYSFAMTMWELVMCDDPYEEMNVVQEVGK